MDDSRHKKLVLGGFVAVAVALLGGLTVMFGGAPKLFDAKKPYTIVFDEAPGVQVGTPVRRSGVVIGEVTAVDLDDITAKVRVGIVLTDKYTIKTNEQPVVVQDIFSRNTSIDFIPAGTNLPSIEPPPGETPKLQPPVPLDPKDKGAVVPAAFRDGTLVAQLPPGKQPEPPAPKPVEPVPPGSVIQGRPSGDARVLIDQAQSLLPTVQKTLDAMRTSIERFGAVAPRMEQGATEFAELGRAIRETVPEIRRTNDEIRNLVTNVRVSAPEFRRTNDELQVAIRTFAELGEQANVLLQTNRGKIQATVDNAEQVSKQATVALQRITDLLSEENVRNATATLRAAQSASAQLDAVLRDANTLVKEGTNTSRQATAALKQAEATFKTADGALANINTATKPFAERSDTILRNLDSALYQLNRTLSTVGEAIGPIGRADGTISRLFTDPSLFNNLNQAVMTVACLGPRLDRILKDIEVFADKIARHPESIGLGGAIRPSAGLKDMPTPQPPPGQHFRKP